MYRHSKYPAITKETNIGTRRDYRHGGQDELIYTETTHALHSPCVVTFDHDQREKEAATGRYKTDLDQVYNRYEENEVRERLRAKGQVVTNDLAGKNECIIKILIILNREKICNVS